VLEFDVHLTKDGVPILLHDSSLLRTHHKINFVSKTNYEDLVRITEKDDKKLTSLVEVLDEFFGKIMLNIELKTKPSAKVVMKLLKRDYVKSASDWNKVLISSFKPRALRAVRKQNKRVALSILHATNPFLFIAYYRALNLEAVGWHNAHMNSLALAIAKKMKLFTYVYTVNHVDRAKYLESIGLDAVVTNFPDRFVDYPRD
jgi:glycerophosphoryl diester phosphodiesterase